MLSLVASACRRSEVRFHRVRAIFLVLPALLILTTTSLPAAAQVAPYETAREKGVLPEHNPISFAPWEAIDPWSGNAMLSFVDFSLPGNAGFDLVVRRVYNSKDGSWNFDIGMPRMGLPLSGQYPKIVNGDGSISWLLQQFGNSDIYWSTSFWRYTASTRTLQSPAGVTYTFDGYGRPLSATDPFGNQQTVAWSSGRIDHIEQTLGNGQSRQLVFGYDAAGHVASLSCQGRTWQYAWLSDALLHAIPPAGPQWSFAASQSVVGSEQVSVITVTTPTGGWVRYESRKHLDAYPNGYDPRWDSYTIRSRQWGGTGVTGGELQFTYPSDGAPTTTIAGANGLSYLAELTFDSSGTYWTVPVVSATLGNGGERQVAYAWVNGDAIGVAYPGVGLPPYSPDRALLPSSVTTTQDGRTYTRSYQYGEYDWNNFGQPTQITDSGDYTHSTTPSYQTFPIWGTIYLGPKPSSVTVDGISASAQYDSDTGFMTSRTAGGVTTTFYPDAYGNVDLAVVGGTQFSIPHSWGVSTGISGPGANTVLTVNPDGSTATATRNGHTTFFTYDAAGRLTGVQPPIGNPATTTYASDGTSVTTTRGLAWTTACLDGFGRTAFTFDGTGVRTDVQYDALGRVIRQSLPYTTTPAPTSCASAPALAPPSTTFEYDALGRVTRRTNANGKYVTYAFDGTGGLRTRIANELGHITTQIWQASGTPSNTRLGSVTNADAQTTTYVYDGSGSLHQVLAPASTGLSKTWTYDADTGHLLSETQPESGTVSYTYDALGRLATRTSAAVGETTYGYDAANRITGVTTVPPPELDPAPATAYDTTFGYDASGNRTAASNGYVTTEFTYDAANRLTDRVDTIVGHRFETRLAYDSNDNLTDLWYPSGNQVKYDYDGNNRLIRVYDTDRGLEFARDFVYRPSGALASYTSGNGIVNTVAYNDVEQPTHVASSGGVVDLTYTYDDAGNVTGIADPRPGQTATFTYGVLNRLATADGPWGSLGYQYDAVGNRTASALTVGNTTTSTLYAYSATTDRLLSAITGQQYEGFSHDDNGRLTQDGRIQTYTYTPQNLVETATTWSGALNTYRYDADGQRVLHISGSETSRTYVVNELSEFSTEGGTIRWTVDYVSAGSRLLAAVRPASGTLYQLTVAKSGAGVGRVTADPAGLDCGPDCSARYLQGTSVTLTAVPDSSSAFVVWGGACSGSASTVTVTVDASKTCTATFTQVTYTLTIQKTGDGSEDSVVASIPAGLDCGPTCSAQFGGGASVQLTVSPADGVEFVGWEGQGCSDTVTMAGDRTCTAVFQALPPTCDPDGCLQAECRASGGGRWDEESCSCQFNWEDPLVLTLDGRPIHLTSVGTGVWFDVDGDGVREPVAWTRAGSTAALLVLDLDGDGLITTGAEIFGMPVGAPRRGKPAAGENSFTLLAAYDDPANGGNGDGMISAVDVVFSRLRLWVDANHDGVSQPDELVPLAMAGVVSIELTYRSTGRRDGHGNFYRYRGAGHLTSGRSVPIWDVFLATRPGVSGTPPAADEGSPIDGDAAPMRPEEAGPEIGEESESAVAFGSGLPDPPPTPLQVVEYYHLDALGSVRAVTDAQGQVIARHDFLPFGEELAQQIPPRDRRLFTGQERDFETALDYLHARQLRVDLGRFTAPDPLTDLAWTNGMRGASNAYSYVGNNPVGLIDPTGAWGDGIDLVRPSHQSLDCATGWSCGGPYWTDWTWVFGGGGGAASTSSRDLTGQGRGPEYVAGLNTTTPNSPNKDSWWDCMKKSMEDVSLQAGLKKVSGGRLGDGWLSEAFLGSSVEGVGNLVAGLFSGEFANSAKSTINVAVGEFSADFAEKMAGYVPNVTHGYLYLYASETTMVIQAGVRSLPFGTAARVGAGALKGTLGTVTRTVKWPLDFTVALFASASCSIGR
jgi:RHS repeat-associated protein